MKGMACPPDWSGDSTGRDGGRRLSRRYKANSNEEIGAKGPAHDARHMAATSAAISQRSGRCVQKRFAGWAAILKEGHLPRSG